MTLLTNIEKKPFQAYTVQHGIERIQIQIPLQNAKEFEAKFAAALDEGKDSKADLLRIMSEQNGSIRKKTA